MILRDEFILEVGGAETSGGVDIDPSSLSVEAGGCFQEFGWSMELSINTNECDAPWVETITREEWQRVG